MEQQVIFRDYQEQQAADHNDLQSFVRGALDHVVADAVTRSRRYAGFNVIKSAQTEATVAPGRFYDQDGAVFARATSVIQSVVSYLPAASKRIVSIVAYGVENETDVEERDFLTNVETGQTEPQAVAMVRSRDAVVAFIQGAESSDPQPPAIPATNVEIARLLLDTVQIVSVTMIAANAVESTENLDLRTDLLEDFKDKTGPRLTSLASDLASLQSRINALGTNRGLQRIAEDLAKVKASLRYPATASDYGADWFLDASLSDTGNVAAQGYDARVEEGARFPDANADEFEISLFSANDPNASLSNGVLLPKYTHELRIATGVFATDLGIAQYGFQTVEMKQGFMSRTRLRYGGSNFVCSNTNNWGQISNPDGARTVPVQGLYDSAAWNLIVVGGEWWDGVNSPHEIIRYDSYWLDTWNEPFIYAVTVDHTLTGAHVAQTFLASNDLWATKLGLYVSQKGANEDIHVALCEVANGVPNLDRTIMKTVIAQADIVVGWNRFVIPPTFLQKGARYAVVLVSNANHKLGMADGQGFLEGTFFYSTDGGYFQGDLTKDLMLEVYGARFNAAQVTIEFAPINLDGGFRFIDILAAMWVPQSTQLIWEMRPNGAGDWQPLTKDNTTILAAAPPLAQFRARFVGTGTMQAALTLTGSRVHVSRPKLAFKHVSTTIVLATPSDEIHIKVLLEGFDETPHDHTCVLKTGVGLVNENPDTTTTTLISLPDERYEREYVFLLAGGNISQFRIVQTGATNSAQNTFHVAERTYYAA